MAEALFQSYLWFPAKFLTWKRDIKLTLFRIILRQSLVDNLRRRTGHVDYLFSKFEYGEFTRVTEVYRPNEVVATVHHEHETLNHVIHIAKRSNLGTVTEGSGRLLL